jgi:hypothetical protein
MATITGTGIAAMARMIAGVSPPDPFTFLATGSGSTVESADDTALAAENTQYGAERAAAVCVYSALNTVRWSRVIEFSGNVTIQEIGVFNAAAAGDMFLRVLLAQALVFASSDQVEITITHTMTV